MKDTVLVDRQPDASLLTSCSMPDMVPVKPTAKDAGRSWLDTTAKLLDCSDRFEALKAFIVAGVKK